MDSIKEILSRLGYESPLELEVNEAITVEVEAMTDLTIERIGEAQLSVAHHRIQMGDLMCVPEVVFDVDAETGEWTAVEFTQHDIDVYQHDESGLPEVQSFADGMWDHNLRAQGFVEAAGQLEEEAA